MFGRCPLNFGGLGGGFAPRHLNRSAFSFYLSAMEIFKALLIHLIVPAAGFLWFLKIRDDMREKEIERPPVISLFIVFAT